MTCHRFLLKWDDQAAKGVKLDFMVTKDSFKPSDRVTVAVENPQGSSFDDSVLLSNVVELKFPDQE